MDYPRLLDADELGPGAPSQADLDALAEDIRAHCGWHIAPQVSETLTLDSDGQNAIPLPTLRLVNVTAVRYWNGHDMVPVTGWDSRRGWSAERCSIYLAGGFPVGRRALEVDVVHGYTTTPLALAKGMLALLSGPSATDVASESLPGHAVTFKGTTPTSVTTALLASSGTLSRYRLAKLA